MFDFSCWLALKKKTTFFIVAKVNLMYKLAYSSIIAHNTEARVLSQSDAGGASPATGSPASCPCPCQRLWAWFVLCLVLLFRAWAVIPNKYKRNCWTSPYPTQLAIHHHPRFITCASSALGEMQYTVRIAAGRFSKHIFWKTIMKRKGKQGKGDRNVTLSSRNSAPQQVGPFRSNMLTVITVIFFSWSIWLQFTEADSVTQLIFHGDIPAGKNMPSGKCFALQNAALLICILIILQRGKPFGRLCYFLVLRVGIHVTVEVIIVIKSRNEFSKYTIVYYSGQPVSTALMLSTCTDHSEVKPKTSAVRRDEFKLAVFLTQDSAQTLR